MDLDQTSPEDDSADGLVNRSVAQSVVGLKAQPCQEDPIVRAERLTDSRAASRGAVVKRGLGLLLGFYLLLALGNRLAERLGAMRCGCAADCWCQRPGLSLFRWVFPWKHRPAHTADEKARLGLADA